MKKTLIFTAYGNDILYHQGAIFNFFKLIGEGLLPKDCRVAIYTDRPDFYEGLPVEIVDIQAQMQDWTLYGRYHFRVKNQVLQDALVKFEGKILHLDSDIFINKNLNCLFDLINDRIALLYLNEGAIIKPGGMYGELINDDVFELKKYYKSIKDVKMYGSAVIGINNSMADVIRFADQLLIDWIARVNTHTVEQFALSESLIRNGIKISTAEKFTFSYSSGGSKAYARASIEKFFSDSKLLDFERKCDLASKWKIRRSLFAWIRQKLKF